MKNNYILVLFIVIVLYSFLNLVSYGQGCGVYIVEMGKPCCLAPMAPQLHGKENELSDA